MENLEQNVNSDASQESAVQSAPLPTYESINADAPVATASIIEERAKQASKNSPLGAFRDESRRRRENDQEKKEDGAKREGRRGDRKERGDRNERKEQKVAVAPKRPQTSAVLPNRREGLASDLEDEFNALLEGESLDSLMKNVDDGVASEALEEGTKVSCRIESVQKDSVFVNIGARELGLIPLKQFPEDATLEVGQQFEAVVTKFNSEDGVYEVALPLAAAEVGDWLSITKGAIVEARVTKVNTGGLECEVGRLRAFMPNSQIATFYVENAEPFIGEKWKCIVTEVNPERRNLVVSRRALMEKEREEQREKTMAELAEGQTREGSVRKIIDVGAFVDLGGVDGFIPISAMSWGRVKHPSDIVKEGDKVTVTIVKIDTKRNRISLSLKDAALDPWKSIDENFREGDVVRGQISNIMDFGAFVELAGGLEGLVHISEIAYQRVNAVADVLKVGEFVDVKILSIDSDKRKVSLSIKKTQQDPRELAKQEAKAKAEADAAAAEAETKRKEDAEEAAVRDRIRKLQTKKPLKGGLTRKDDGDKFGLHF